MGDSISNNKVVITRNFVKKLIRSLDAAGATMREDDLLQISIMNNTLLIETDDTNILIKLDKQV